MILVIALTGLLASLLLPVISGAKATAEQLQRLSSLRQSNLIMHMYGNAYDDMWPHYTLPPPEALVVRVAGQVRIVPYFHGYAQWHVILADQFLDGQWQSEVYAPGGEVFEEGGTFTGFHFSASLRARPEFWNGLTRTGPNQWLPTRQFETQYTSEKAVLVDRDANHLSAKDRRRIPLALADGSAENALEADVEPAYHRGEGDWYGAWFRQGMRGMHTIDGVRGRDLHR